MTEIKKDIQPLNAENTRRLHGTVVDHFNVLTDPRVDRSKRHKLLDIIFIAISAVICGADNWKAIEVFAKAKKEWLKTILELPNGVPSHVTFWRVFRQIDPTEFQKCFSCWIQAAFDHVDGDIIAIDGKTIKGSRDVNSDGKALHIVSAWAAAHNITLAQVKVDEKSNEITAIPPLLDMIAIEGAVVTADAMSCQKNIAEQIIARKANYVLALKGNQSATHSEIENYFRQALDVDFQGVEHDRFVTVEKGHGRIETRTVYATNDLDWLPYKDQWANLTSIIMVVSERKIKGKTSKEVRFYLSSLVADASRVAHAIRTHWGIENKVHWMLDVVFGEDKNQLSGNGAENFSVLSKIAMNLLKQEKRARLSMPNKRFKAAMDHTYLETVLKAA
ncbi:MAG: ISAs1 family transposase [Chlamydiota bacterium]